MKRVLTKGKSLPSLKKLKTGGLGGQTGRVKSYILEQPEIMNYDNT